MNCSMWVNRLSFVTSSDSNNEKVYKKMSLESTSFHEPVHVQYLHWLKDKYIKEAGCIGKNLITLSEGENKVIGEMKKEFSKQIEFNADIVSALEDYNIACIRRDKKYFFSEKSSYRCVIKKKKYKQDGINHTSE